MYNKGVRLYVTSDASASAPSGAAVSIITSKEELFGVVCRYYRCKNSGEAELWGIVQALKFIDKSNIPHSEIQFNTDHDSIVILWNNYMKLGELPEHVEYKNLWKQIMEYAKKDTIIINSVQGHTDIESMAQWTNNTCDIIAKMIKRKRIRCGTGV